MLHVWHIKGIFLWYVTHYLGGERLTLWNAGYGYYRTSIQHFKSNFFFEFFTENRALRFIYVSQIVKLCFWKKQDKMHIKIVVCWIHLLQDKLLLSLIIALPLCVIVISKLMLSLLGNNFSRQHIEIIFLFFPESRIWHYMQSVSNLLEMSNHIFWKNKKNIISLLSAEFVNRLLSVNDYYWKICHKYMIIWQLMNTFNVYHVLCRLLGQFVLKTTHRIESYFSCSNIVIQHSRQEGYQKLWKPIIKMALVRHMMHSVIFFTCTGRLSALDTL